MSDEGSAGTKGLSFSSGAAIVTSIGKILTIVADLLLIVAMFIIILSKEDCKADLDDWKNYTDMKDNPKCCTGLDKYWDRVKEDKESAGKKDYEYKKTREWKCYPTHTHFGAKEDGMVLFTPLCFAVLILAVLVMALIGKPEGFIKYFSFVFTDVGVLVLLIALSFITFPWIKGGKTPEKCDELMEDMGKECKNPDEHKDENRGTYYTYSDKCVDLRDDYIENCDGTSGCTGEGKDMICEGDCLFDTEQYVRYEEIEFREPSFFINEYKNSYKLIWTEPKGEDPFTDGVKDPVEVDHFWAGGYYFGYFPFWASLIAWVVCLYLLVAAILRLTHILKA